MKNAWDPISRILNLGTSGLGLIIVKPGERNGCKNRNIQIEEMVKVRKIENLCVENPSKRKRVKEYPFDLNKVVLGAKFNDSELHFSDVILDRVSSP